MNLKFLQRIPVTPEERKLRKKQRMLGLLSGLLMGLAFPPVPFPFTLLIFLGLVPYLSVLEKKEKLLDINRFTYLTFFIFNIITIYWVGSWTSEADPFLMVGGILLLFINTAFFLIPSTLYYFARKTFGNFTALMLLPFFWVSYEYFYMITDASFPWLTLGNGMTHFLHFIQIADIIGALGLSLLAIYINTFFFLAMRHFKSNKKQSYIALAAALVLFIVPIIYSTYRLNTFKVSKNTIKVGLIQPNLDPWDKWSGAGGRELMHGYLELSREAAGKGAQAVFWPETALPFYLRDGSHRDAIDSIYNFVQKNGVYLITGMPDFIYFPKAGEAPPDAKYSRVNEMYYATYNSVLLFSPYSYHIERYAKQKLVPFGERVPFVDALPFLGDFLKWNVGLSGWNIGRDTLVFNLIEKPSGSKTAFDTVKVNSLVCFESVYPAFVAAFAQRGAQLISVVTNDSWYGNSSGPYQHKEISVLRAIENRRTVVRAANGGISTIIDPLGRTVVESKMFTRTEITGNAPLETVLTFYSKHPLIIPYLSFMVSGLMIIIFFGAKIFRKVKRD
ncbi:MAG: apolipoprotein N-acyltransferase [Ignavibacteria bacterium]|nr:apolipoprotein N-acyltransferase [Ignavibacteria bacterium]MCU7513265.1 apolipoprotein N-acyltransferase [Ignavibacteria bacterium]MCU7525822.1 apolipoprotein N-acyltransferase [Ignavibacteria bacterium]